MLEGRRGLRGLIVWGKAVAECGGYDLNALVLSSSTGGGGGESIEGMDRDLHNAGFFAGGLNCIHL